MNILLHCYISNMMVCAVFHLLWYILYDVCINFMSQIKKNQVENVDHCSINHNTRIFVCQ